MTENEIKVAEARGYSRGYNAGKKRKEKAVSRENQMRKKHAFWQRAFLAALPVAMTQDNWKRGDKPIVSVADRTKLATEIADEALNHAIVYL